MSTFPGGANPLAYNGVVATAPPQTVRSARAPASTDRRYKLNTLWIDVPNNDVYMLTSVTAGTANWQLLGNSTATPLGVDVGGTGVTSITAHTLIVGDGTNPVNEVAAGTNGQVLVGSTGADPVFATIASSNSSVTVAAGAGTLGLTVTQATTTQLGGAETATDAEALAEASTTVVLTPSNLAALGSTTSFAGLIEIATNTEARTGTDTARAMTADDVQALRVYTDVTFSGNPIAQLAGNAGGAAAGATGDLNILQFPNTNLYCEQFILGAGQTIILPQMNASGLLTSLDLTNAEGCEYNGGQIAGMLHSYTIGTSPAFFIEATVKVADTSGLDHLMVGFRKQQTNAATVTDYTDFATIGLRAATASESIVIQTDLNNAGEVYTDTTDSWADAATKTLKVLVSAAGVVTYTINGSAPSVTAAYTFDNGDVVTWMIRHLFNAAAPGAINITRLRIGLQ